MSEPVKPALTPEEWRKGGFNFLRRPVDDRDCHGLAALCLYGQSFGFSQRDIDYIDNTLRWLSCLEIADDPMTAGRAAQLTSLRNRIAALLPPERSETP